MTAFQPSDLPSGIDTVEKLAVWTGLVLNNLYFDVTAPENRGEVVRVAQISPFEITASDPMEWRIIARMSIPMDQAWLSSGKMWEQAKPLGNQSIPSGFLPSS